MGGTSGAESGRLPIKLNFGDAYEFDANNIMSVAMGNSHTCAISRVGEEGEKRDKLYCWGRVHGGLLSHEGSVSVFPEGRATSPVPVNSVLDDLGEELEFDADNVKKVRIGSYHTCAIDSGDRFYCWGMDNYYELGNSTRQLCYAGDNSQYCNSTPSQPDEGGDGFNPNEVSYIELGQSKNYAIDDSGELYFWGHHDPRYREVMPTLISDGSPGGMNMLNIKELAIGGYINCAIDASDDLYCWEDGNPILWKETEGIKRVSPAP